MAIATRRVRDRGTQHAIHTSAWRRALVALLALAVTAACHDEKSDNDAEDVAVKSSMEDPKPSRPSAADFSWPRDSSHPSMRLEITNGDREGTIEIELMPELAPKCVQQVLALAGHGYYDGTTFHRVIPGFMIQGGDPKSRDDDPSNDGRGGSSTELPDEISTAPFERGVVALANHGRPNSNSSQFFIMQNSDFRLNGRYTVLGRVAAGIDVVDQIATTPTDKVGRWGPKDRPIEPVQIRRATVGSAPIDPQGISPGTASPP